MYYVLDGTLQLTLGDGLTQPSVVTVGHGYTFVLRPHNYLGLLNPSPSASAALIFVHFLRERPAGAVVG